MTASNGSHHKFVKVPRKTHDGSGGHKSTVSWTGTHTQIEITDLIRPLNSVCEPLNRSDSLLLLSDTFEPRVVDQPVIHTDQDGCVTGHGASSGTHTNTQRVWLRVTVRGTFIQPDCGTQVATLL